MHVQGIVVVAAAVLALALVSRRLENTVLTPPMVFTAVGLLIGPAVLGWADLSFGHGFLHGLAEVTLLLVLFTDAARIDVSRLKNEHDLPLRMLLIGMPLVVLLGALIALVMPFGFTLWEAALLAAVLAPTDAALGQAVVVNPAVPARIRQAINVESGLNDGLALPLVLLFGALAGGMASEGGWLLFAAKQVSLGPLAGALVALIGGTLIDRAAERETISESFQGPAILALAFLAFAGAELIGGNGFIAAFVAGLVFGNRVRGRCTFIFEFAESEGQLLILLTFLIFGASVVPETLASADGSILLYAALSLTLIRMIPIAISLVGSRIQLPTYLFLGWFGPRGLASVLFGLLVLERTSGPATALIVTIVMTTVVLSVVAHGLTANPAARWYGNLTAEMMEDGVEMEPVSEMPTRTGMVEPLTIPEKET